MTRGRRVGGAWVARGRRVGGAWAARWRRWVARGRRWVARWRRWVARWRRWVARWRRWVARWRTKKLTTESSWASRNSLNVASESDWDRLVSGGSYLPGNRGGGRRQRREHTRLGGGGQRRWRRAVRERARAAQREGPASVGAVRARTRPGRKRPSPPRASRGPRSRAQSACAQRRRWSP